MWGIVTIVARLCSRRGAPLHPDLTFASVALHSALTVVRNLQPSFMWRDDMRRLFLASLAAAFLSTPALAVPSSPSDHGIFDSGAYPPAASGIVTIDFLNTTLGSYVTSSALNSTLSSYLTQSQAASTYLPLAGGSITGNLSVSGNITLPGSTSILSHDIAHILALAGDFSTSTQAITNSNNVSLVTYGTGQFNFYSSTLGLVYSISSSAGPTIKPLAGTGNAYACVNTSGTLYRSSSACQ